MPEQSADDELPFEDPEERPEAVPDSMVRVPADEFGYAVTEGDVWVQRVGQGEEEKYGDHCMVKINDVAHAMGTTAMVAMEAIRTNPKVPTRATAMIEGEWMKGDYSDLVALRDSLSYFEKNEAGLGQDKLAYDMRTLTNHAMRPVRKRIDPHHPV